jgi:ATP-binding cassette subfamily B multidrug efflux pump
VYRQRQESGEPLTIVTVAHRLSNFRYVDRLVVMEDGKVAEQGPPKDLLQNENGLFALFLKRQTDTAANFGAE